jgi:hypothetical protein
MLPSIARGTEVYAADASPVRARGYSLSRAELDAAAPRVQSLCADQPGLDALASLFEGMEGLTGFDAREVVKAALEISETEDHARGWREGEALAEAWLVDHKECEFPWPFNRDLRHPRANLPGPELIGFSGQTEPDLQFAFGQVKTSKENVHPPTVVRKKDDGLTTQLMELRNDPEYRVRCVLYLAHRCSGQSWESKYRAAATRYFQSASGPFALFGVLVRDVQPSTKDLENAARALSDNCPPYACIDLAALYLPPDSITKRPPPPAGSTRRNQ